MNEVYLEETLEGTVIEIPKLFGSYEYIRTISAGSNSVAIMAKDYIHDRDVACKFVSREDISDIVRIRDFERELRIIQNIRFQYIIETYEILYFPKAIVIVMEYCCNGDLLNYVLSYYPIPICELRRIFRQILMAIDFLHKRNIVHRDIKPENIFLDNDFNIKVGDFGVSRYFKKDELCTTICGTLVYTPPELISMKQYDPKKADVWSLGILLYVLYMKKMPWHSINQSVMMDQIKKGMIKVPMKAPLDISRIILECTKVDPSMRPNVSDLLVDRKYILDDHSIKPDESRIDLKNLKHNTLIKYSAAQLIKAPINLLNSHKYNISLSQNFV